MAQKKRTPMVFCTTREAADLLNVSLRTAQLWVEKGLLEAWKTSGGHRRISRQSIESLLASSSESYKPAVVKPVIVAPIVPSGLSILVVEDDLSLRRLYKIKIGSWLLPTHVTTAEDGYEALIRIGNSMPDMMVTDLQMGGMDGFRMLNAICSMPSLSNMNIIVVSGLDAEEIESRGGVPEGITLLPKPVPFDRLYAYAEKIAIKCGKFIK
jgi:excisionase family DNA binding protein